MSLITDALQKARRSPSVEPTSTGPPPSAPRPPWWSAALLIGLGLALVWAWPATHREAPRRSAAQKPAAPPATRPQPIMALMPAAPSTPAMAWQLDGVIIGRGRPTAIVNGELVEEGGEVQGAKVVRVKKDGVELLHHGEVVRVAVDSDTR